MLVWDASSLFGRTRPDSDQRWGWKRDLTPQDHIRRAMSTAADVSIKTAIMGKKTFAMRILDCDKHIVSNLCRYCIFRVVITNNSMK
ncbi:uncharacterized protein PHALS_00794 [Plasmopara halstedii]|uniref:Uncharacterized protein n=1 Tax=Plasmopara halstedii TaxID=4781 RepID=A0A0P1ARX7_PLAHL|nr:uncharacterized protein PHALS_00794 [Plasmopara halstedii]CEG44426.1 hypothetical protein PHALS_00794 [Plasmopara halstedii]|eukprot:XP_024580795.1 hypothetical protein PHALS_00794 [Plasmopara halstedii]